MIVLREYERIGVDEKWNSDSRVVGREQQDMLLYHQEKINQVLLKPGFRCLKATSWVGTLGLGEHCLDVIPKIDDVSDSLDEQHTRQNLLWMIWRAGLIPVAEADITSLAKSPNTMLVAFLRLYVQKLSLEWARGPIREYVVEEENRPFLKGKLLFAEHLRINLINQHLFYTRTDEFTIDNPLSALLKAALIRCADQLFSREVALDARRLLLKFSDVSDRVFTIQEIEQLQASRQHLRFEKLILLAKMILQSSSPDREMQVEPIYSLMFDMNVVFERFIAAELQAALFGTDLTVQSQLGGKSLLYKNGKSCYNLRPDIGVFKGKELVCLIDTKWKRLDPSKSNHGVSQADMYQMYAYGKEFDAPLTILLYPHWGKLTKKIAEYNHPLKKDQVQRGIEVSTIPISSQMSSKDKTLRLRKDLIDLVFSGTNLSS